MGDGGVSRNERCPLPRGRWGGGRADQSLDFLAFLAPLSLALSLDLAFLDDLPSSSENGSSPSSSSSSMSNMLSTDGRALPNGSPSLTFCTPLSEQPMPVLPFD